MVIATMHRPSTAILNGVHRLVLDHGGQMAYWGDVPGMMRYFRKAATDMAIDVSEEARTAGGADYVFEGAGGPPLPGTTAADGSIPAWQERFRPTGFRSVMGHHHRKVPRTAVAGRAEISPAPGAASPQMALAAFPHLGRAHLPGARAEPYGAVHHAAGRAGADL